MWGKERGRERYEIDTLREGNTEREAKNAKPETGRIKGRDGGRRRGRGGRGGREGGRGREREGGIQRE